MASSADRPPARHPDVGGACASQLFACFPGLARLATSAADAVTVTDTERRVVVWNRACAELYGIPPEDATGRPIDELIDSTIVGAPGTVSTSRRHGLEDGRWRGRAIDRPRIGRLTGRELVIDAVLSRLQDDDGATIGVLGIRRDITDTAHLERELTSGGEIDVLRERLVASERRYRTLFQSSPEPYLVETLDGHILDANEAAATLFHGDIESLRGLPLAAHVRVGAAEADARRRMTRRLGRAMFPGTGIRLDGTTFPQEAIAAAVELDGEEQVLVHIRDLTERERLQQELIQAQKMEAIGQLVSGVAHELNNPLAAILLACEVIQRDARLPDDVRQTADLLVDEATRTRRIVQNLLDFARQRAPERHPSSIRALVDTILMLQSYSLAQARVEIEVDIPDGLPLVELDRPQIQQVLINLTQNAIYSLRAAGGGRLLLGACLLERGDGRWLRISVEDDGGGVARADVARLFVPFFTTKPSSDGTGLGLPVSQGIVASHGGDLWYEPAPGAQGAIFRFDLPVRSGMADQLDPSTLHPSHEAAAGRHGSAAGTEPGLRVLVLDDEDALRGLLVTWLRGSGHHPVVATSGEEALDIVRASTVDLVLCDHRMTGMDGIHVFEAIAAAEPRLRGRFVVMSGDVLNDRLLAYVRAHGLGFLAKPFDLDTVERTIRRIVDESGDAMGDEGST